MSILLSYEMMDRRVDDPSPLARLDVRFEQRRHVFDVWPRAEDMATYGVDWRAWFGEPTDAERAGEEWQTCR